MSRLIGKDFGEGERNGGSSLAIELLPQANHVSASNKLRIQQSSRQNGPAVVPSHDLPGLLSTLIDRPQLEEQLVKDALYACRGIDGVLIKYDESKDSYVVRDTLDIPPSIRNQVSEICELGFLYRKVESYVTRKDEEPAEVIGITGQAFCFALQTKLEDYRHFLTTLEKSTHIPIPTTYRPSPAVYNPPAAGDSQSNNDKFLSLMRLSVISCEALQRLKIMAAAVDHCRGFKGGVLAGSLELQLRHGDPLQTKIVGQLLRACCGPILDAIQNWVLEGKLEDTFNEFFVVSRPGVKEDRLWQDMYRLEEGMLPRYFPTRLGMTILRAGKSINFLRRCCEEEEWVSAQQKDQGTSAAALEDLGHGQTESLEKIVSKAAAYNDSRLLKVIMEKFHLLEHCNAIKRYLLVSRIDFVRELMDRVSTELSRPVQTVSVAALNSGVTATVTSLSYDVNVLERLDVKLLPSSSQDTKGWQVFSLDYQVHTPLRAVLTEEAMTQYRRIFNFLWRLNRVIYAVEEIFLNCKRLESLKAEMGKIKVQLAGRSSVLKDGKQRAVWQKPSERAVNERQDAVGAVEEEWKTWVLQRAKLEAIMSRCLACHVPMKYFVRRIHEYVMLEAIEGSWTVFEASVKSAQNLDELIVRHKQFVETLIRKPFLGEQSRKLKDVLHRIWDSAFALQKTCSRLESHVREVLGRLKDRGLRSSEEEKSMGGVASGEFSLNPDILTSAKSEVSILAKQFSSNSVAFLYVLGQNSPLDLSIFSSHVTRLLQKS